MEIKYICYDHVHIQELLENTVVKDNINDNERFPELLGIINAVISNEPEFIDHLYII